MSKHKQGEVTQTKAASTLVIKANLHLLDLDRHDEWSSISLDVLSTKETGPNQKARIECVEWVLYHLFEIWDAEETTNKLQPFFPPLESLQSINLRAALFRCLNQLKLNGTLGKDVILRKTMLEDCKGEKVIDLLASFSTLVLRRTLEGRKEGKGSIARRLLHCGGRQSGEDSRSLLPLAIAHQADLRKILGRKETLRARYKKFGQVLDAKDTEMDRKFEKVVETQIHLDENIASEATVARIGKQLELHWQGDRRYIDVIAQGGDEDRTTRDALLDNPFQKVWTTVTDGAYVSDVTLRRDGLLEDLERRVEVQNARLQQWQELKAEMLKVAKPSSPTKQMDFAAYPRKATHTFHAMEKDLVFSPRRSPRKSMLPAKSPPGPSAVNDTPPIRGQHQAVRNLPTEQLSDNDDSGFSEAASQGASNQLNSLSKLEKTVSIQQCSATGSSSTSYRASGASSSTKEVSLQHDGPDDPPILNSRCPSQPVTIGERDQDNELAERIISKNVNASPTPIALSLIERTRQSMAQASPGAKLSTQPLHTSFSTSNTPRTQDLEHSPPRKSQATLLERTRQSISLVPPKIRQSRTSIHNRRSSKVYPTNQFETPRKFGTVMELTPPDELFSPGAGYDSVFRSRPKVGFSPTATPEPTLLGDECVDLDGPQAVKGGGLEESPLARLVAKV